MATGTSSRQPIPRLFTAFFAVAGVPIALASFGIIGASHLRRGQAIFEEMGGAR